MTIETIPLQDIAYIRRVGPYGQDNYAIMDAIKSWAWSKGILSGGTIYGIAYDSPDLDPSKCRFDACIVLEDLSVADDKVQLGQIPEGDFAVFEVGHDPESIEKFWHNCFQTIADCGLSYDESRPIMERYREQLLKKGMSEFCVPIKK